MKILVAEDDMTSRILLTGILRKHGHDIVPVADGMAAWKIMQTEDAPNLAILDWNMPGMDGLEVCRDIRKSRPANLPYLIILTARGEKGDIVRGLDAGANDYISKPYDNDELQARIRVGQRMVELQLELLEAKKSLSYEAMHDPLTGALNRRAILEGLSKELVRAGRLKTSLSIGLCDIDHFKRVNDTYGHPAGDDVLCGFVKAIQNDLRSYDLVGRFGGEEFLVIAPDSKGNPGAALYERLKSKIASLPIPTRSGEVGITVSIGVSGGEENQTVDTILAAADNALYRAKEEGRNRVAYGTTAFAGSQPPVTEICP